VINTIKLKEQREAPEKVSMRTPLLMHEIDKFGQHFGISVALE